jgi:hypothetical protein
MIFGGVPSGVCRMKTLKMQEASALFFSFEWAHSLACRVVTVIPLLKTLAGIREWLSGPSDRSADRRVAMCLVDNRHQGSMKGAESIR